MKLRYTRPALADLSEVLAYVSSRSPRGGNRVNARIQASINRLKIYPRIGARTDDPFIRRIVVTPYPYRVFYEVGDDEIIIHAIRHAARKPSSPVLDKP